MATVTTEQCETHRTGMVKCFVKWRFFKVILAIGGILVTAGASAMLAVAAVANTTSVRLGEHVRVQERQDAAIIQRLDRQDEKLDKIIERMHERQ